MYPHGRAWGACGEVTVRVTPPAAVVEFVGEERGMDGSHTDTPSIPEAEDVSASAIWMPLEKLRLSEPWFSLAVEREVEQSCVMFPLTTVCHCWLLSPGRIVPVLQRPCPYFNVFMSAVGAQRSVRPCCMDTPAASVSTVTVRSWIVKNPTSTAKVILFSEYSVAFHEKKHRSVTSAQRQHACSFVHDRRM